MTWLGQGRRTRIGVEEPSSRIGYSTLKPPIISGFTKVAGFPKILSAKDSILRHWDDSRTCLSASSQSSSLRSQARLSESSRAAIIEEPGNENVEDTADNSLFAISMLSMWYVGACWLPIGSGLVMHGAKWSEVNGSVCVGELYEVRRGFSPKQYILLYT